MLKLAILCGGPSKERGISLNSARSFLDHASPLDVEIAVFYVDLQKRYYRLQPAQLYSNTPADFDFKLSPSSMLDEKGFLAGLREADLVFPLIHGAFGEDGTLQALFEKEKIPFVGSPSAACRQGFNKYLACEAMRRNGFPTLPCLRIASRDASLKEFWEKEKLQRAIVKPTISGSSLGVRYVDSLDAAQRAAASLFDEGFPELMLEPYCEETEFSVCVLQNREGRPVSLLPIEIDFGKKGIFDYRKKYLPSEQKRYYCPPRFSEAAIGEIQAQAERFFQVMGLRDYARIDGWISSDGSVRFSDLNPYSGMEQNSFIFQQAARVGISHTGLIAYILENALCRYEIQRSLAKREAPSAERQKIYVLMGGDTSERQVSLMGGTNVWLKLLHAKGVEPVPFLLDPQKNLCRVWQLPYAFTLHHTVEELVEHCEQAPALLQRAEPMVRKVRQRLGRIDLIDLAETRQAEAPRCLDLEAFLHLAKQANAFVFLVLHGGMGENGQLQKRLEEAGIPYNGSDSQTSHICMDKYETARQIRALNDPMVLPMEQISLNAYSFCSKSEAEIYAVWDSVVSLLKAEDLIMKPQCDGCSTGVVRLRSKEEFLRYIACLREGVRQVPKGTFRGQDSIVEMPVSTEKQPFLIEPFIHTDKIQVQGTQLIHRPVSGWCEMTLGVLEKEGIYRSFHPSITVAESSVLSVEEKFQGGTGVNITPPPESLLSQAARLQVEQGICRAAKALGIRNYARFDLFVELATGKIRVIEANTLPALTPSTVLYHQALAEQPPIPPKQLLLQLIQNAAQRNSVVA